LEEEGGLNLYGFIRNASVDATDSLGLNSVVGLPAQIPFLIKTGWTAAQIAETFGVALEVVTAMIAANELADQISKAVDNFQNNAKGKDPCDKALHAVRQAQRGIQNSLKRIAEHEAKLADPSAYLDPGKPAAYGISVWTTQLAAQKKGLEITQGALKVLEKAADTACRCWYKPWTWF
jgi:hypothetical protein